MSENDRLRWDERFASGDHTHDTPSRWLTGLDEVLPRRGRALDIAGGAGRNALWLARRGLDVTLADISEVGLGIATQRARDAGVPLTTARVDLEAEPLPRGPWDVIAQFMFLERALFRAILDALLPGGWFVMLQPTVTNLERRERPPRRVLLEPGEARALLSGFEIVRYDESWSEDDYHEARVLARRPLA